MGDVSFAIVSYELRKLERHLRRLISDDKMNGCTEAGKEPGESQSDVLSLEQKNGEATHA
jgi:hypothetical protein